MFTKIRSAMLALAAVATIGIGALVATTDSADARGFHGGGGFKGGSGSAASTSVAASISAAAAISVIVRFSVARIAIVRTIASASASVRSTGRTGATSAVGLPPSPLPASTCVGRVRSSWARRWLRRPTRLPRRSGSSVHLPDQGIHAGQPGGVQGPLHEGSRFGSGRQHAAPAADAAAELTKLRAARTRLRPGSYVFEARGATSISRRAFDLRHQTLRTCIPTDYGASATASDPLVRGPAREERDRRRKRALARAEGHPRPWRRACATASPIA